MIVLQCLLACVCLIQEIPDTSAVRGITGNVRIEIDGGQVRGRPDLDLDSPLLVRIAGIEELGDDRRVFEVQFIGVNTGIYDLREVLVVDDVPAVDVLEPIPVEIISQLGEDAPTDVFVASTPPTWIPGGYWRSLLLLCVAWILVPIVVLLARLLRPRDQAVVMAPLPTIVERLQPLLAAANKGELSIAQQGELELLLYSHWQDQLELGGDRPTAIRLLRRHEVAGRLLRAVESWLHAPNHEEPSRDDMERLLDPYRSTGGEVGA